METQENYVYLYRDGNGRPIYVGRGRTPSRAQVHVTPHAHNAELADKLKADKRHSIEIAGPFGLDGAKMVEAALISAIFGTPTLNDHLLNAREESHEFEFRSLAVPAEFADRRAEPLIGKPELDELTRQSGGPILFVNVRNEGFFDAERDFDPANPPGDADLLSRLDRKWRLNRLVTQDWNEHPERSPRTLVGLYGPSNEKIIIGAASIDLMSSGHWNCSERNFLGNGLLIVPVPRTNSPDLDALKLRGRRVAAKDAGLSFGNWRHQQFQIYSATPLRRSRPPVRRKP